MITLGYFFENFPQKQFGTSFEQPYQMYIGTPRKNRLIEAIQMRDLRVPVCFYLAEVVLIRSHNVCFSEN